MKILRRYWWVLVLLAAVAVAVASPLASPRPDGLERVAGDQGFLDKARRSNLEIMTDYLFPGIHNQTVATILAGVLGTLLLFAVGYGLAWALRRRSRSATHGAGRQDADR